MAQHYVQAVGTINSILINTWYLLLIVDIVRPTHRNLLVYRTDRNPPRAFSEEIYTEGRQQQCIAAIQFTDWFDNITIVADSMFRDSVHWGRISKLNFLDNGNDGDNERRIYGRISTR